MNRMMSAHGCTELRFDACGGHVGVQGELLGELKRAQQRELGFNSDLQTARTGWAQALEEVR